MQNNLLEFVLSQIDGRKSKLIDISRESGVPYETLKKIAYRRTPNPGVLTVQALANYFSPPQVDTAKAAEGQGGLRWVT